MKITQCFCLVFILFIQRNKVSARLFDNLGSGDVELTYRRQILTDLRRALNDTNGTVESALAVRYPEFLNIAVKIVNTTENATNFNQSRLCQYIDDLLSATIDLCGIFIDRTSPCHIQNNILKDALDVCLSLRRNITHQRPPVGHKIVTEYFLLAVKVLVKAAMFSYER